MECNKNGQDKGFAVISFERHHQSALPFSGGGDMR